MIVDDNRDAAESLAMVLAAVGHTVRSRSRRRAPCCGPNPRRSMSACSILACPTWTATSLRTGCGRRRAWRTQSWWRSAAMGNRRTCRMAGCRVFAAPGPAGRHSLSAGAARHTGAGPGDMPAWPRSYGTRPCPGIRWPDVKTHAIIKRTASSEFRHRPASRIRPPLGQGTADAGLARRSFRDMGSTRARTRRSGAQCAASDPDRYAAVVLREHRPEHQPRLSAHPPSMAPRSRPSMVASAPASRRTITLR